VSIGAAYFNASHTSPPDSLAEADKALYEAKKTRNAVVFYEDMEETKSA
jgi:GGDEF domain-containing protein